MKNAELLQKTWLVTASIGTSAVRNQGNGIAQPIRAALIATLSIDKLMNTLQRPGATAFNNYLEELTDGVTGLKGISNNGNRAGHVKWGTARKCVNLVFRTIVYNGFIWQRYGIRAEDFKANGIMRKLELPLDSYVIKGIRKDCEQYKISFDRKRYPNFSIIGLDKEEASSYYQNKASEIAHAKNICRIRLDEGYWRNLEDDE